MNPEITPWKTTTSVYRKLRSIDTRIVALQGSAQCSKTISVLQNLGDIAIEEPRSVISVFGMTYDHLKRGALHDFKNLIETNPVFAFCIENPEAKEGAFILTNKSKIEFIALDKPEKALGAKRTHAFFNEANAISYEIYERIALRTTKRIFLDYNPTARFWVHDRVLPFKDTATSFISNFTHNEYCPEAAVQTLKGYYQKWKETGSPYWQNLWRVFGLGLTGIPEGVVFPHITIVSKFPDRSELKYFGYAIDWGFSQDPTAIIKCGINQQGEFVGQELFYHTGINAYSMDEIFSSLNILKNDPIVADSANPDAIDWLQKKGWNIFPADKPAGSVKQGIELLNQIGINIVQGSENLIKEQAAYVYKTKMGIIDKDEPVDASNHAFDAIRYFARFAVLNKGVNPKKARKNERQAFVI